MQRTGKLYRRPVTSRRQENPSQGVVKFCQELRLSPRTRVEFFLFLQRPKISVSFARILFLGQFQRVLYYFTPIYPSRSKFRPKSFYPIIYHAGQGLGPRSLRGCMASIKK